MSGQDPVYLLIHVDQYLVAIEPITLFLKQ